MTRLGFIYFNTCIFTQATDRQRRKEKSEKILMRNMSRCSYCHQYRFEQEKKDGPDRGSNPEPLAPKARIIPLDHQATVSSFAFIHIKKTFIKRVGHALELFSEGVVHSIIRFKSLFSNEVRESSLLTPVGCDVVTEINWRPLHLILETAHPFVYVIIF